MTGAVFTLFRTPYADICVWYIADRMGRKHRGPYGKTRIVIACGERETDAEHKWRRHIKICTRPPSSPPPSLFPAGPLLGNETGEPLPWSCWEGHRDETSGEWAACTADEGVACFGRPPTACCAVCRPGPFSMGWVVLGRFAFATGETEHCRSLLWWVSLGLLFIGMIQVTCLFGSPLFFSDYL